MRVFVRDECEQGRSYSVDRKELYTAYTRWAETNGHPKISSATFGRNLRAAMPGVSMHRLGGRTSRHRYYVGLRLRAEDDEMKTELEPTMPKYVDTLDTWTPRRNSGLRVSTSTWTPNPSFSAPCGHVAKVSRQIPIVSLSRIADA